MWQKLILLGLAGALGTLARYGLGTLVQRLPGAEAPWSTLAVNILGCFLAGLVWALFETKWPSNGETRVLVLVGFFGAFTTFSALYLDTGELIRSAKWAHAATNVALQNGLGLMALFGGAVLGRMG